MKKQWIHINFWFKKAANAKHRSSYYLNKKDLKEFQETIGSILKINKDVINRKFFLFEPKPHCFLAIETTRPKRFYFLRKYSKIVPVGLFKKVTITKASDQSNGEPWLNAMNALTDLILSPQKKAPAWLGKYPKEQRLPAHVIHCFLNSLTNSRPEEIKFYGQMIHYYTKGLK